MKTYILTTEIREKLVYAKLPREVAKVSICFITSSKNLNQTPSYQSRLEVGHDFEIKNGYLVSRKIDLIGKNYLLIQVESNLGKKCKTCRKENQTGSFCSQCGSYLF